MNANLRLLHACLATALLAQGTFAQEAGSSFGHARTRQAAALGRLPTPLEVAVADIVNYHRHRLPIPRAGEAVALDLRAGAPTVRPGGEVFLQIGLTTIPPSDRRDQPPLNLALVLDVSGSMADAGKMAQVKSGLRRLADRLRPTDQVALIAYSTDATVLAPTREFGRGVWFRDAIRKLKPSGRTNLHGGLMLGFTELQKNMLPEGSNRVLLLTDGIANVGETAPEAILKASKAHTSEGIDLSTIGVGANLNTALLDRLARGGRGLFHFVADGKDLEKVFVSEVDMLLTPVARQASIRLELPPHVRLEQVYGHEWRWESEVDEAADDTPRIRTRGASGNAIRITLPDLNAGLTSVVMVKCRASHGTKTPEPKTPDEPRERARTIRATFLAQDATTFEPMSQAATATVQISATAPDPLTDVSVRKNQTIAQLAQGMHDMAQEAQAQRWIAADRALRRALTAARTRYPHREDKDVATVLQMAEAHEQTLLRHVDRFDRN